MELGIVSQAILFKSSTDSLVHSCLKSNDRLQHLANVADVCGFCYITNIRFGSQQRWHNGVGVVFFRSSADAKLRVLSLRKKKTRAVVA